MSEIRIITTSDGSHSLLNTALNETYHSVHGAIQESQHVFILNGLDYTIRLRPGAILQILEIGFGTGLNAFLTLLFSKKFNTKIYYQTWETHPLESSIVDQLNYRDILGSPELFSRIHDAAWGQPIALTASFEIHKQKRNIVLDRFDSQPSFDLIYYDAFAPGKQPEMWTMEILKKITTQLKPLGVFVTYCAKGQVKRDLKTLGLSLETLSGPPGKNEMIRASRPGSDVKN